MFGPLRDMQQGGTGLPAAAGQNMPYALHTGAGSEPRELANPDPSVRRDRRPERLLAWLEGRQPERLFGHDGAVREVLPEGFEPGVIHVAADASWGAAEFVITAVATEMSKRHGLLICPAWMPSDHVRLVSTLGVIRRCCDFDAAAYAVREALSARTRLVVMNHIDVLLTGDENPGVPEHRLRAFLREMTPRLRTLRAALVLVTRIVYARDGWRHPMRAQFGGTLRGAASCRLTVTGNSLADILRGAHVDSALSRSDVAGEWINVEANSVQARRPMRTTEYVAFYATNTDKETE